MGNTCSCCSNGIKLPAVEDVNHLDEAISFLETRLDAILIDKPEESTSGAETSSASVVSSIEYGSYFLETVVRRVKRHTCKVLDCCLPLTASNSEIQKVVTETLKEAEQAQWVGAGVAVVAYVLDQVKMDKISSNRNECVEVLRFMCGVAKHIKRQTNHLVPEKLNDLVAFIVKGSIFCMSRMQSTDLSSSVSALVDEEEIKSLQSQLVVQYEELGQYPDEDYQKNALDLADNILSSLNELMSYIETRLAKRTATDKAEENASPVEYGRDLLENVLKLCKRRGIKIISGESRKVVIDVLKEATQMQWVAAGLSIVAYVLQKVDDASTNKEECFQYLQYMYDLAKHIKQLDGQITVDKIHDVAEFIFKGSFFCVSRIQSSNLSRFFSSVVDIQEIKRLESELGRRYQDLTVEALTEALHRMPIVLPPSQGQYPDAVGIEGSVLEVTKLLGMNDKKDESIRAVVIYGVGGMGKTTLANAVFSSLDLKAYRYCHLIIKQDCSETDVKDLQAQILKDMFDKNLKLKNSEEGHEQLSNVFREARQPLFMFIDNALKGDDLAKILPRDLSCFPKRSRLLLTTRKLDETDILDQRNVITRRAFPINSLPYEDAKKLLSKKALDSPVATFDASSDIDGLLRACGGIPLVLNLVGTRLRKHHNNLDAFNSTIETFKDSLGKGDSELTERVVDVVYNSLPGDRYKDAFLDIAAFFSFSERQFVSYIVGEDELVALEDAALVKINNGQVQLHDVIFKRGRKLSESDRIINDSQSLTEIIEDTQRLEKVKGICLSLRHLNFQLQAEHVDKMHKCLRILIIRERTKVTGACTRKFENLRYLKMDNYECSPIEISQARTPKLVIFEGRVRSDHRLCELPDSLRRLKVNCLESSGLDESFGKLSRLENLELHQDEQYMTRLPQSFGQLKSLRSLLFMNFRELTFLPNNFAQLSNLKDLHIQACPKLSSLSDDFGQMKSLQSLVIYYCGSLERLSDTFGQLSNLKRLMISDCSSLSILSDDFGQMKSLQSLTISLCRSLERLSDTFGQLSNLKELTITKCSRLSSLSDDFGSLACVTRITASDCPLLEGKAVDQIIELKSLMVLDIRRSQLLINRWKKIEDGHPHLIRKGKTRDTTVHFQAGLSDEDSKKFLCLKALGSADKCFDKSLDIDYLLRICRGIPSVLEMVGSMLRKLGNDVSTCESTIQFLKDTLGNGEGNLTKKIVNVVYDTLQEDVYKDAFQDITAFFCKWRERTVGYIVEEGALRAIEEAALVQISKERGVIAHDIVQARGKKMSKEVRITDPLCLPRALQHTQRLEKLKGIRLALEPSDFEEEENENEDDDDNENEDGEEEEFQLKAKHLDKMHKCLRVLSLGRGAKVTGACSENFENLRYLKINNGGRSPMELNKLPRLAIFEGRIRIHDRLCNLPDSLRRLKVDALESDGLDESFGKLSRLEELDISQNENYMTILPQSFGQLKSLRCLKLSHFRELTSLPDTFGELSNLEELNISGCANLSSLCENFGKLSKLKRLKLINCESLLNLCDGFGELNNLKKLDIVNCTNLASLSDRFDQLRKLKKLVIVNCSNLSSLCSRFGQLQSLKYLRIRGCGRLQKLSDDFGPLARLTVIDSSGCPVLEGKAVDQMIELKSLMVLNIRESQLLIKRWEEVKEGSPLLVRTQKRRDIFLTHSMSRILFDAESRFVDVDGEMVADPSTFTAGEGKIVFLVTCCDLLSPSNEAACEVVKIKMRELCREGFQMIYVGLMEQSEESIGRTVRSLSEGIERVVSLCTWIRSPSTYEWKKLFGFFACMMFPSVLKLHTFIARAHNSAGNLHVEVFPEPDSELDDEYDYESESESELEPEPESESESELESELEPEPEPELESESKLEPESEPESEPEPEPEPESEEEEEDNGVEEDGEENKDDDKDEDENKDKDQDDKETEEDEKGQMIDLRDGFSSLYSHWDYSFISSTI